MSQSLVIHLAKDALTVSLMIAAPILLISMAVGVAVSIFQAVTQIQEMTLTFVPKVLAVSAAVLILGPWMLSTLTLYTTDLLASLPNLVR